MMVIYMLRRTTLCLKSVSPAKAGVLCFKRNEIPVFTGKAVKKILLLGSSLPQDPLLKERSCLSKGYSVIR